MLRATDCPVFEVKAKFNVWAPSDGINRLKSIDYSTNLFRLVAHLEAKAKFDDVTKTAFKFLDFFGKCTNVGFSIKPRKGDG